MQGTGKVHFIFFNLCLTFSRLPIKADPKKQKGVKMQGFLLKKKEKIGKWKQQFFLLKQDGADSHLYFYDNPKVRPEGGVRSYALWTILPKKHTFLALCSMCV